jgi:hypothetical protein
MLYMICTGFPYKRPADPGRRGSDSPGRRAQVRLLFHGVHADERRSRRPPRDSRPRTLVQGLGRSTYYGIFLRRSPGVQGL